MTRAKLIAFIDDDAIPDDRWVETAIKSCPENSNLIITGPERPVSECYISQLIYSVSKEFFLRRNKYSFEFCEKRTFMA